MAKRLLDFGVHPPTIYFPLNVDEGMMIEPTETESKETLDYFCDALIQISEEAKNDPDKVLEAPHHTIIDRLDETKAARKPVLKFDGLHAEKNNSEITILGIKKQSSSGLLFQYIIFRFDFACPLFIAAFKHVNVFIAVLLQDSRGTISCDTICIG